MCYEIHKESAVAKKNGADCGVSSSDNHINSLLCTHKGDGGQDVRTLIGSNLWHECMSVLITFY